MCLELIVNTCQYIVLQVGGNVLKSTVIFYSILKRNGNVIVLVTELLLNKNVIAITIMNFFGEVTEKGN